MKSMGEMLLRKESFSEIVIGNTAVVRAMVESGVKVVTSYPGSPTPEIAAAIGSISADKRPFYFEFSTNEKVATEVAFGASINGHLSTVFFKSVGLNVAADSFVQLSLMELPGGMVIIIGDDPGANSSQNEQDNRHIARLSYTPVFEPATPAEVYSMYKEAASISQKRKQPVILRLSTHVCHAKEKVKFDSYESEESNLEPRFDVKNGPYVPLTKIALKMKARALKKLESFKEYTENSKFNILYNNGNACRGIITAGVPFLSLLDVLEYADEKPDILKLGTVFPLPEKKILDFLKRHEEVKILEELDDFFEQKIKSLAYDEGLKTKIVGKIAPEDWAGEYVPDKVYSVMKNCWPDLLPEIKENDNRPSVPARPAQMCPGCGHRSAFYAIKRALKETDITVADIGCHTLGFFEPYEIGQVLLCMGHSTGTASGLSMFNKERKVVAFLGDSTFFHAGMPGIVNAVFNNHNVTLIVMENGTTAMTGHQDHPGSGKNFNQPTDKIPIRQVLEGFGVKSVREVDTYNQKKLSEAVIDATEEEGFSVVIATHPCMLKFTRELRRKGRPLPKPVKIGPKCNRQYVCVSEFACPTFQISEDGSVWVQKDLCIGDRSCVQTCPVSAIVPDTKKEGSE